MIKQPLLFDIRAITFEQLLEPLGPSMSAQQRFDLCRSVMDN